MAATDRGLRPTLRGIAAAPAGGERKTVTALFADERRQLFGFDEVRAALGWSHPYEVLIYFHPLVASLTERSCCEPSVSIINERARPTHG
jgi:hypothetical protein